MSSNDILFLESANIYLDTTIEKNRFFEDKDNYNGSLVQSLKERTIGSGFKGYLNNHEKLALFIFSKQVVDTTPWDKIRKDYLILKRYDLDLKTLDSLNWRIVYK